MLSLSYRFVLQNTRFYTTGEAVVSAVTTFQNGRVLQAARKELPSPLQVVVLPVPVGKCGTYNSGTVRKFVNNRYKNTTAGFMARSRCFYSTTTGRNRSRNISYKGQRQSSGSSFSSSKSRENVNRNRSHYYAFDVMVFDKNGDYEMRAFTKPGLLKDTGLHARDLIVLDSGFHRRPRPAILIREGAFIVCMSFIRAIICADNMYLFHSYANDVKTFTTKFSDYLKGRRPPFLPSIFLGAPSSWNPLGDTENDNNDSDKNNASPIENSINDSDFDSLPFECKALEGILSHVCRHYYNRTELITPLVENVLDELSAKKVNPETLHKLLPMKDFISLFEIETTLMRNCLNEVLQNDEDMVNMLLSEKKKHFGTPPPIERHEEVELLLENYCSQMVGISQEAYYLRKRIESTQSIIELKLDTYRNHMIGINMQLAMAGTALAGCTVVAGIFGMNLLSGLEAHPQAFWIVSYSSLGGFFATWYALTRMVENSLPQALDQRASAAREDSIFGHLGDIQYILSFARASKTKRYFTRDEFKVALREISGLEVDEEHLDIIYRTFDLDGDGKLNSDEVDQKQKDSWTRSRRDRSTVLNGYNHLRL